MEMARRSSDGSASGRRSLRMGSRHGTVKEDCEYKHLGSLDELLSIVSILDHWVNFSVSFYNSYTEDLHPVPSKLDACLRACTSREMSAHKKTWSAHMCSLEK